MQRLTKRMKGVKGFALLSDELDGKYTPYQVIDLLANKLADYEDLGYDSVEIRALAASFKAMKAEAEPLLRAKIDEKILFPPCRIGEKIYVLMHGYVESEVVEGFIYRNGRWRLICGIGDWFVLGEDAFRYHHEAKDALDLEIQKARMKMEEKTNGNSVNR